MNHENIKNELRRITDELNELFELIHVDYSNERAYALSQYNMGVMVGIGYAQKELEKLVQDISALDKSKPVE